MLKHVKDAVTAVALWITIPLWFPVLFVLLGTEVAFLPSEWRLRRQMRRAGRTCGIEALAEGGTLIHDSPTFSWIVSRIWWTPDDVLALAPVAPLTKEQRRESVPDPEQCRWHEFDRWVSTRYLDPLHGTALLIAVWHPDRTLRRLRKRFPSCRVVDSWSGGRDYERYIRRLAAIDAEIAAEKEGTKTAR